MGVKIRLLRNLHWSVVGDALPSVGSPPTETDSSRALPITGIGLLVTLLTRDPMLCSDAEGLPAGIGIVAPRSVAGGRSDKPPRNHLARGKDKLRDARLTTGTRAVSVAFVRVSWSGGVC